MIASIFLGLFLTSAGWTASPTRASARLMAIETSQPAGAGQPRRHGSPILRVEDLQVVYRTSAGEVPAVDDVSFSLRPGRAPGPDRRVGLGQDDDGHRADAPDPPARPDHRRPGDARRPRLLKLDDGELRQIRLREIALVPQGAMNSLNPVMRIEDQIIDAIVAHEREAARSATLDARVDGALGAGRPAARRSPDRYPHELSAAA